MEFWKVTWIESERGWGQRVDDVQYFDQETVAREHADRTNKQNTATSVPDYYVKAYVERVSIPEQLVQLIGKKLGIGS